MWNKLRSLDIFSYKPSLRVMRKEKFKSLEGGVITFSIMIIAILLLIVFSENMITSSNPHVNIRNKYFLSPPETRLNFKEFNIAIGMRNFEDSSTIPVDTRIKEEETEFEMEKLFDIEFMLVELEEDALGNTITKKIPIPSGPCNASQFEALEDSKEFTKEKLENRGLICMLANDITLEGRYGSKKFAFLDITIRICNPAEDKFCKANEKFRNTSRTFLAEMFMMDSLLDMNDHLRPVKKISKRIYTISSFIISKMTRVPIEVGEVFTSDGWSNEKYNQESINYLHVSETQEAGFVDRTLASQRKSGASISYEIFLTNIKKIYERKYEKIYDIIAKLGGVLKILLILGRLCVSPFSKSKYNKALAKAIGVFPDNKIDKNSKKRCGYSLKIFCEEFFTKLKIFFTRKKQYSWAIKLLKNKMDMVYLIQKITELDYIRSGLPKTYYRIEAEPNFWLLKNKNFSESSPSLTKQQVQYQLAAAAESSKNPSNDFPIETLIEKNMPKNHGNSVHTQFEIEDYPRNYEVEIGSFQTNDFIEGERKPIPKLRSLNL